MRAIENSLYSHADIVLSDYGNIYSSGVTIKYDKIGKTHYAVILGTMACLCSSNFALKAKNQVICSYVS